MPPRGRNSDELLELRRMIGKRMRGVLRAIGTSSKRMSEEMGVSDRSMQNWQSGVAMPPEALLRFIVLTEVNPRYLLTGKGKPFRPAATPFPLSRNRTSAE